MLPTTDATAAARCQVNDADRPVAYTLRLAWLFVSAKPCKWYILYTLLAALPCFLIDIVKNQVL